MRCIAYPATVNSGPRATARQKAMRSRWRLSSGMVGFTPALQTKASLRLVDGAAADYCAEDFGFCVFAGRNFCDVGAQDDEVGVLADYERPFSSLFKLSVGGAGGVGADAIVERYFFLRLPAARGATVGEFAGDAGVEAAHGIDGLDVVVGAECEMNFVFQHRVPRVGALDAFGAAPRFGPPHVGGLMRRLH